MSMMPIHGHAITGRETTEYRAWTSMLQRCSNPNAQAFKDYGARGIKVCKRWRAFSNFLSDMGLKTIPTLSLERRNNGGNYTPTNCYWATSSAQRRNQRSTILNETRVKEIRKKYRTGCFTQQQLATLYGCGRSTIGYVVTKKNWRDIS